MKIIIKCIFFVYLFKMIVYICMDFFEVFFGFVLLKFIFVAHLDVVYTFNRKQPKTKILGEH